jgi:uncharacterized protein YozE (UPF0346 family)
MKKNKKKKCIIAAVGKESLHHNWIDKSDGFDLHLIVYDDSFEKYKNDTVLIQQSKGQKFKLIYDYLTSNIDILNQYDYFYIPDDDILIDVENIHHLFDYMEKYKLAIAQPALTNSYYSYLITVRKPDTLLRYTNFIEMMQPCFSRKALKKVLFTFNENASGWGIDFHWGILVDFRYYNMAIIDDVISVHTRPVRSNHFEEFTEYLKKYNLARVTLEIESVNKPAITEQP